MKALDLESENHNHLEHLVHKYDDAVVSINCQQFYKHYHLKQKEIIMKEFKFGITTGLIILCFITLALIVKVVGFKKSLLKLRYIVTFHWLFETIIGWREGKTPSVILDQEFKDFVENDAEFVDAVVK